MANGPIGINFMPTQDAADMGRQRGSMEGDLGEAIKVLSLRAPRVVGARSITPGSNLDGAGAGGLQSLSGNINSGGEQGGFNPNAALFQALISALMGGGGQGPAPRITPGITEGEPTPGTYRPNPNETGDMGGMGGGMTGGTGPTGRARMAAKYMPEMQQNSGSGDFFNY